jgi:hypothetical protein
MNNKELDYYNKKLKKLSNNIFDDDYMSEIDNNLENLYIKLLDTLVNYSLVGGYVTNSIDDLEDYDIKLHELEHYTSADKISKNYQIDLLDYLKINMKNGNIKYTILDTPMYKHIFNKNINNFKIISMDIKNVSCDAYLNFLHSFIDESCKYIIYLKPYDSVSYYNFKTKLIQFNNIFKLLFYIIDKNIDDFTEYFDIIIDDFTKYFDLIIKNFKLYDKYTEYVNIFLLKIIFSMLWTAINLKYNDTDIDLEHQITDINLKHEHELKKKTIIDFIINNEKFKTMLSKIPHEYNLYIILNHMIDIHNDN